MKSSELIPRKTVLALEDESYKEGPVTKKKRNQRDPKSRSFIQYIDEDVSHISHSVLVQSSNKFEAPIAHHTLTEAQDASKHDYLVRRLCSDSKKKHR